VKFTHQPRKKSRIELIPMIDLMMFLLAFFVLISINVIPSLGHKTVLPSSSSAENQKPRKQVIVSISEDNLIQLDGFLVQNLNELLRSLIEKRQIEENISVLIKGDRLTTLQTLVDVMDSVKKSGIDTVTIATRKK
jgi:biopolymer transport protein ExbD